MFQSIYHSQDDFNTALYYVDRGIEYCARINAFFCQILFQLTKAMVKTRKNKYLLVNNNDSFLFQLRILIKDYLDAQNLLKPCLERINALQGNFSHIETLRILYLVLHISCSCFGLGQVRFIVVFDSIQFEFLVQIKSSKNALMQLQQSIQNLASRPEEGKRVFFFLVFDCQHHRIFQKHKS